MINTAMNIGRGKVKCLRQNQKEMKEKNIKDAERDVTRGVSISEQREE